MSRHVEEGLGFGGRRGLTTVYAVLSIIRRKMVMVSLSELIELRMTNWAKAYIYGAAPPYEGGDACVECGPERPYV